MQIDSQRHRVIVLFDSGTKEVSTCEVIAHIFEWLLITLHAAGKCTTTVQTEGENINICWSPDGNNIAVGDKVCPICP